MCISYTFFNFIHVSGHFMSKCVIFYTKISVHCTAMLILIVHSGQCSLYVPGQYLLKINVTP